MQQAPKIKQRNIDQAYYAQLCQEGLSPVLARIVAGRPKPEFVIHNSEQILQPKLSALDSPFLLKDMDKAVARVIDAMQRREIIAFETDHDCDGQTSHAVLFEGFTKLFNYPTHLLQSYIGHRLEEGYGLSEKLATRILAAAPRPNLVITADNGSSDEARIAMLAQAGIEVIVTDHHELPIAGSPKSAYAVINPTQTDCPFPDKCIAGCMVAWLLVAAVRRQMIKRGLLSEQSSSPVQLLDFVAVGTVADCVSMARSANNRAVVRYGLQKIAQAQRPCWQAIMPLLRKATVSAEDLGFTVGPLLNSDGRLSDAFGSVHFLLANDIQTAGPWAEQLWQSNQQRKAIQKALVAEAMTAAAVQVSQEKFSIVVAFDAGHVGVHGIAASRIKDAFGRPTILFSTKEHEPELLSGSARSIDELHLKQALDWVAEQAPDVLVRYGGHKGAAGLSIAKADLQRFSDLFEQACQHFVTADQLGPVIYSDGELPSDHIDWDLFNALNKLAPYGREFDTPVFETDMLLQSVRWLGADQTHARLSVCDEDGRTHQAIWFQARGQCPALEDYQNEIIHLVFQLTENCYRDQRSLQLQVVAIQT